MEYSFMVLENCVKIIVHFVLWQENMTSQARVCLLSTMWNWLTLSSVEWFIYCLHIFFNNTFFLLYAGFERLILVSILSKLCIWDQWTTLYTPCSVVRLDKLAIFVHSPSFVWDQILFHSWNYAKTSSCSLKFRLAHYSPRIIKLRVDLL